MPRWIQALELNSSSWLQMLPIRWACGLEYIQCSAVQCSAVQQSRYIDHLLPMKCSYCVCRSSLLGGNCLGLERSGGERLHKWMEGKGKDKHPVGRFATLKGWDSSMNHTITRSKRLRRTLRCSLYVTAQAYPNHWTCSRSNPFAFLFKRVPSSFGRWLSFSKQYLQSSRWDMDNKSGRVRTRTSTRSNVRAGVCALWVECQSGNLSCVIFGMWTLQ